MVAVVVEGVVAAIIIVHFKILPRNHMVFVELGKINVDRVVHDAVDERQIPFFRVVVVQLDEALVALLKKSERLLVDCLFVLLFRCQPGVESCVAVDDGI